MKFTIYHTDKKNQLHVSTRSLERFLGRIVMDDSKQTVTRFREMVPCLDYGYEGYKDMPTWHHVCPAAEFEKDASGNLCLKCNNGVLMLCFTLIEEKGGMEAAKQKVASLPSTLAAFMGADGISLIVLVKYALANQELPHDEAEAERIYQQAFHAFAPLYQVLIQAKLHVPKPSLHADFLMTYDPCVYYEPDAVPLKLTEQTLDEAAENTVTLPSVSQEKVDKDGERLKENIQKMMAFLQSKYKFRYNSVMKFTEYQTLDKEWWGYQPVDGRVQKRITLEVQLAGIKVSIKDVRNFLESDYIKNYNPVENFLMQCYGKWDGKDRIRALARTVPTLNEHWEDWFYTWFLGMVDQWRGYTHRLYGNSVAPLLISKQGFNKSTFCRRLLPQEFQWGYCDNLILSEKRQVFQAMTQYLLINLDEFNQISPQVQQGFLKNLIQLPNVKLKPPYGSHVMEYPRIASFIATSNMEDILSDPSGNRRFIGVELTGPIDVSQCPNYVQLYAQALAALANGEKCYFDAKQTKLLMESNKQFEVISPAEQYFRLCYEPTTDEEAGVYLTTGEIFDHLKQRIGSSLKISSLSSLGRKLGQMAELKHKRTRFGTKYLVREIK